MGVYETKVLAHRGASEYAPENSMQAFKLAYEMGADGIEFDVHFSKDEKLIIVHDETINRTSNGEGFVKDFTLNELLKFNFNNNMQKYREIKIPTLDEILTEFSDKNFLLNIEIKNNILQYSGIEKAILNKVLNYNVLDKVVFSSFNHESILKVKNMCPKAKCAFLYADGILDMHEYLNKYNIQIAHPAYYLCTENELKKLQNERKIVNVWTVNKGSNMRCFMNMGVDAIITNKPDLAVEIKNDK